MPSALIIRSPGSADCPAIIRCITEARGRRYYSEEYYDPAFLLDVNERELFAAYDENGDMMGFIGLINERFSQMRNTLSFLNVRPCYTGRGVATVLLKHCVKLLRERGEKAIKGYAVTNHASIQKVLEDLGLRPTGILPGMRDGGNAKPVVSGKHSLTVHVCNLVPNCALTLYLHREIAGLCKSVYDGLEVDTNIISDGCPTDESTFKYQFDAHNAVLLIQVIQCGSGINKELRELTNRYGTPTMTTIVLLNLGDSGAVFGYRALCDDGWRFSGFDPLGQYENAVLSCEYALRAGIDLSQRTKEIYEKFHLQKNS